MRQLFFLIYQQAPYKNWQHCKLATLRIFKISLIDSPMDAFEGGITVFGIISIFKKIPFDRWEGRHLKEKLGVLIFLKNQYTIWFSGPK